MNILSLKQDELIKLFIKKNFKAFCVKQIFEWIYQKKISSFDEMSNLSLEIRSFLNKNFTLYSLKLKEKQISEDKQTQKYLFELEDGYLIESVLILSEKRITICLSTQVGCDIKCTFCASGKKGFFRDLLAFEIIEQIIHIAKDFEKNPTHIVFMGMGEPLLNLDELIKAIEIISNEKYFNISQRRITISTAGVLEGIIKLKEKNLKCNLALSLHAPDDEIRNRIMPYSKKYKLKDLLKELQSYFQKTKRDLSFEYILIENINDDIKHAKKLYFLLKDFQCSINLIPYNPISGLNYKRPENERIKKFKSYLISKNLNVSQRYTKGNDIAASCGQLALQKRSNT